MNKELTQESIRELFNYRNDGKLIRKISVSRNTKVGDIVGSEQSRGYYRVRVNYKHYLLHRLIFLYHHGYLPETIDHIDGDTSNNSVENLRESTKSQNQMNRRKHDNNCSSIFKGVHKIQNKKWKARIQIDNKRISLGIFKTEIGAALAYNEAAKKYYGKYAKINIIR